MSSQCISFKSPITLAEITNLPEVVASTLARIPTCFLNGLFCVCTRFDGDSLYHTPGGRHLCAKAGVVALVGVNQQLDVDSFELNRDGAAETSSRVRMRSHHSFNITIILSSVTQRRCQAQPAWLTA